MVHDLNHRVRQAMSEASGAATSRLTAERAGFRAFFRFTAEHPALYRIIRQAEFVSPEAMRMHYSSIVEGYIAVLEVLQERTLRVDRVLAAVVTERPAERPADLNLSQVCADRRRAGAGAEHSARTPLPGRRRARGRSCPGLMCRRRSW